MSSTKITSCIETSLTQYGAAHTDTFCIPVLQKPHKVPKVKKKKHFDLLTAIEDIYPIVHKICTLLPFEELKAISQVSEAWQKVADVEIGRRKNPSWLMVKEIKLGIQTLKSRDYDFTHKLQGFLLYDYKRILLNKYMCIHDGDSVFRKTFYEHIMDDVLTNKSIDMLCVSLKAVIPIVPTTTSGRPLYTCFFLPEIPGIRTESFSFAKKPDPSGSNPFDEIIRENQKVECLLIFGLSSPVKTMTRMMQQLEEKQSIDITIGGGLVWGLKSNHSETPKSFNASDLMCIAFISDSTKDNKFFSASAVIEEYVFAERLVEFKKTLTMHEHSVIFRFCCFGKDGSEVEDGLLKEHFPNTHLVQMEVNGEIGYEKEPENEDEEGVKTKKMKRNFFHQFTTILVFISWGKVP